MHVLIGVGLLSLVARGALAAEVPAEEIKAFEEARDTLRARTEEFAAEARATVARQETADRAAVNANYDAIIESLQSDSNGLRTTAMRRFEQFLDRYPTAPHSAHVMFRLAELYFEMAEEDYAIRALEYDRVLQGLTAEQLDEAPEQPTKDYGRSIALYDKILERFPEYEYRDGCYYMLGYTTGESGSAQFDEPASVAWYKRVVDEHPTSPFLAQAHFRIGQYHFDFNELPQALVHYGRAVEIEGVDGSLYGPALYKLAWTNYRLNNYDVALGQLNGLLDWSHDVVLARTGREADTDPEAIRYTAISLADKADIIQQSPISVAQAFYARIGQRSFEDQVYKQLADVLTQQARYDEAIALYEYVQQRWPTDKNNPTFQYKIAQLQMSKSPPDDVAANAAIQLLTERYNDRSVWYRSNRANPDAQAVARDYIEESLVSVADSYYENALKTTDPADYAKAAAAYGEYLKKFPFTDDYYQLQWSYAQMLTGSGDVAGATREYRQLMKGGEHNYREAALRNVVLIENDALLNKYQRYETVPPDAVVEVMVDRLDGEGQRAVYKLGPDQQQLVDLIDELNKADFDARLKDIAKQAAATTDKKRLESLDFDRQVVEGVAAYTEKNGPALDYGAARILWGHGRFDEARERFSRLMAEHPDRDEAAFAAKLDVDAYRIEGDMLGLRRAAAEYAGKAYGASGVKSEDFKNVLERVDFTIAENLGKEKKYNEAAAAYLSFFETYPKSPFRTLALSNAANNYERGGNITEANRLIERFVAAYPDDPASRAYYMRLGNNYGQVLDFDKAIGFYEQLYAMTRGKGIDDPNAPDAIFNAGMMRVGKGDFKGAALNYERYAKDNPSRPDAADIYFSAGEQWDQVSEQDALRFYRRYIADYPEANPEDVMKSLYKIALISEETDRGREVEDAWSEVAAGYRRLAPTGRLGVTGRKAAAHAEYRKLLAAYERYLEVKWTTNDKSNAELLLKKKNELPEFENLAANVASIQDFEFGSGALGIAGKAFIAFGDMVYNSPLPKGLTEEEEVYIREGLDTLRLPAEDKGKSILSTVVDIGLKQKQWSRFQDDAQAYLAERFPGEFAPERREVRATGSVSDVPVGRPISMEDPADKAKPTSGGASN